MAKERRYEVDNGGEKITLYSIGVLLDALQTSSQTLNRRIDDGSIPPTPYLVRRDNNAPLRLFSQVQIEDVAAVFKDPAFKGAQARGAEIRRRWTADGVPTDQVYVESGAEQAPAHA